MRISVRLIAVVVILLSLTACSGFTLRGTGGGTASLERISPLYLTGLAKTDGLYRAIREQMRAANVVLTEDQASAAETLNISGRGFNKKVNSVGSRGKVLEYELLESFRYSLGRKAAVGDGKRSGAITARRIYTNPETQVLGRQHEEAALRRDMWQELANMLIMRLSRQLN